jgi:hypothetical protein
MARAQVRDERRGKAESGMACEGRIQAACAASADCLMVVVVVLL